MENEVNEQEIGILNERHVMAILFDINESKTREQTYKTRPLLARR